MSDCFHKLFTILLFIILALAEIFLCLVVYFVTSSNLIITLLAVAFTNCMAFLIILDADDSSEEASHED